MKHFHSIRPQGVFFLTFLLSFALLQSGCGDEQSSQPKVIPVLKTDSIQNSDSQKPEHGIPQTPNSIVGNWKIFKIEGPTPDFRFQPLQAFLSKGAILHLKARNVKKIKDSYMDKGFFELTHTDTASGESCHVQTNEFDLSYCCPTMRKAYMTRRVELKISESPSGCLSKHWAKISGASDLAKFESSVLGGPLADTYHFTFTREGMLLNPMYPTEGGLHKADEAIRIEMMRLP